MDLPFLSHVFDGLHMDVPFDSHVLTRPSEARQFGRGVLSSGPTKGIRIFNKSSLSEVVSRKLVA